MAAIDRPNLKIYTPDLQFALMITSYQSAEFTRALAAPGTFSIRANLHTPGIETLSADDYVDFGQGRLGIIQSIEKQRQGGAAGETIAISGREAKCELEKRILLPPAGEYSYCLANLPVESVVKRAIRDHFVERSLNPRFADEAMRVQIDEGRGERITLESRYKNLGSALWEIAQASGVGIVCRLQGNALVYDTLHGLDRTREQSVNSRAVLSVDNNSLLSIKLTEASDNYRNLLYVAGPGEGNERPILQVEREAQTGRRLRVEYMDSRDVSKDQTPAETLEKMREKGEKKLLEYIRTQKVEASFNTGGSGIVLGRDFDLGDQCTLLDRRLNIQKNIQLTAIKYSMSGVGGVQLTFGEGQDALLAALNRKFSNLEGVVVA